MKDDKSEVELIDVLNVVWKRKWLIIIPTALVALLAGLISLLLPPVWEVDAVILPSKFFVQTEQGQFVEVVVTDPKQIAGQVNEESYNNLIAAELKMGPKEFPRVRAENLKETNLVRVVVRDENIDAAKAILNLLFNHLKKDLDRKIEVEIKGIDTEITTKENAIKNLENEIKTQDNEIKKKNNEIRLKDLSVQSREIEKDWIKKENESYKNKLKISEERMQSITEEMKSVKTRIDSLDEQLKKVIAEKKEGAEAVSLLLYSNEVQQNLRYYNTLDEKLNIEKIAQENLRLNITENEEKIRQIDNQISQFNTEKEIIKAEISTLQNEIDKLKNRINTTQSEIKLAQDKKLRIDYTQLVKEPTASLYPVSPRKILNVLVAGLLGLVTFTMLAFFMEYLSRNRPARAAKES